ncbi:armadillo-type protein [Chytridium lagenaria]|nr:armadillo-type protein [Chytridium lagenaria]
MEKDGEDATPTIITLSKKLELRAENMSSAKNGYGLKLEKYLSEIVVVIADLKFTKSLDVWAALEICSLLHRRFPDFFTQSYLPTALSSIPADLREREEQSRTAKQKGILRLLMDLQIVGVIPVTKTYINDAVKNLFALDKEFQNLSVAAAFAKAFGEILKTAAFPDQIKKMQQSNNEYLFSKGDISEERQEKYQKALKIFEKFQVQVKAISEGLSLEIPELPIEDAGDKNSMSINYGAAHSNDKGSGENFLWEDEENRLFYEELVDLKDFVPSVLLGEKQSIIEGTNIFKIDEPMDSTTEETIVLQDKPEEPDKADLTENESTDNVASRAEAVIAKLLSTHNRTAIDEVAVEFGFLNSKTARKKLISALIALPRGRNDVLPYVARFIATVRLYMPDVESSVVEYLHLHFKGILRRKEKVPLDERLRVDIRFIAELTKFRVLPIHVPLYVVKALIDDFSHPIIEVLCPFLEACGRFLYRGEESAARMEALLEVMLRKKGVQNLDSRQALLIDNAYYSCNPPEMSLAAVKERLPLELYIRKLLYSDLSRRSVDKVIKQLRKMNWEDSVTKLLLKKYFRKVWKIKFSNIHLMAFMVSELARNLPRLWGIHHPMGIGDECLYNYRMVDSNIIFDALYFILRFGHDSPNDFFRIRVCCTLLDTCGIYFDRGLNARRMDEFMAFLQIYFFSKDHAPQDISFLITETIETLRPKEDTGKGLGRGRRTASDNRSDRDSSGGSGAEEGSENGMDGVQEDVDEEAVLLLKEKTTNIVDEDFERSLTRQYFRAWKAGRMIGKLLPSMWAIPGRVRAENTESANGEVMFSLLTKRGNKQQVKQFTLPSTTELEEKQHLKRLVLNYEERERLDSEKEREKEKEREQTKFYFKRY